MRKSVGIVLATASLVASQGQNATAYTGPGPYPPQVSAFSNANTAGSKTVPFELWYPSESNAPAPTWSWETRIETAEISNSNIANAQQLAQVYNLQWGSDNLADAVGQHAGQLNSNSFCVTVIESLFPKGTTNNYNDNTEDNASDGSCTKPLRKRCTDAIQSAFENADVDANGCRGGNLDLGTIKQCDWTFEHNYQAATYNLLRNSTANAAVNGSFPLNSGDGFAYIATDVYDGTNRTFFDQAEGRLQMIIIDSGTVYTPLCMRINNNEKAQGEATGALGNFATTSTGSMNFWLAGAAVFVGLSYML